MIAAIALLLLLGGPDAGPLSIADLPAYKAALEDQATDARPATFRDIWDAPESYRGRRVSVEGRIRRRFRQPAVGEFPALSEVWISTIEGDPICLVFPPESAPQAAIGENVEFRGTFLRLVRYRAGDADRIAPLIVGSRPPEANHARPRASNTAKSGSSTFEAALAAGSAGLVAAILALKHWNRPQRRLLDHGPAPRFLDEEDADGGP